MRSRSIAVFAVLVLMALGCTTLAYSPSDEPAAPPPALMPTMTAAGIPLPATPTAEILIPVTGGGPTAVPESQPALPEARRLTLDWPVRMRAGDAERIRLTLEVDDQGNLTPTATVAGHQVTGQVILIPDLYETHNIVAEARLDLAGMQIQPAGPVSEPLRPGQQIVFYWSVRPDEPSVYRGAVWLYLQFVPLDGGPVSRRAVSIQEIEIQATTLLGLSGRTARAAGAIGGVVSTVLGLPFLEDVLRWIWRRRRE